MWGLFHKIFNKYLFFRFDFMCVVRVFINFFSNIYKREEIIRTYRSPNKDSNIFHTFLGLPHLSNSQKEVNFSEKGHKISGRHPLRVTGTPSRPLPFVHFLSMPHIGGSLHWWSCNSCCHVWAFTVKAELCSSYVSGDQMERLHFLAGTSEER